MTTLSAMLIRLCALYYCTEADMEKDIFLHNKAWAKIISPEKVRKLRQEWIRDKTA